MIKMENLKASLSEVRKAYRLLYLYQRRVMDLVQFIGDEMGFDFISGHPWFGHPIGTASSANPNRSAWDWLPMYYYDFYFEKGEMQLGIIVQADTGFFDSDNEEKSKIEDFGDPDHAETRIVLMISNGKWDSTAVSKDLSFGKEIKQYPKGNLNIDDDQVKILAKAYNMEKLMSEDSAKQCIEDFKTFCQGREFKFESAEEKS